MVNVWTSETQRIGMVDHDFDPKFIEKVLEKPENGLDTVDRKEQI